MDSPATWEIELEGHLIDEGSLSRVLDMIVDQGGTCEILSFRAGVRREDPSVARLRLMTANAALPELLASRFHVRSMERTSEGVDAVLQPVDIDGTAPEDFYPTTIFPTEVRVAGRWVRCERQRMDAAIVVVAGDGPGEFRAICRLIRDLRLGDRVATGHDGIRMILPERRDAKGGFQFMSAGVSSERRVEATVEQIAADMVALRRAGERIVVVAGPVLVHTGGTEAFCDLIRRGYVSALLGGNAIAVHDIERDFFGTSLGVDLQRGSVVEGGHKHHIRTINSIRRAGGIRQAVEKGTIRSGIMKALVECDVPFVLAGSIRDDGPLPDTVMDLEEAQRLYQEQIIGARMILMLSSMLHSIGVGNMTPAGVKMICVDINPAVATKLADRGSLESLGLVTDVGLFLRLLAEKVALIEEMAGA